MYKKVFIINFLLLWLNYLSTWDSVVIFLPLQKPVWKEKWEKFHRGQIYF